MRGGSFADGAGDQRVAGGVGDFGAAQIRKGYADKGDHQNEYDDVEQAARLFMLAPAGIGLKRIHSRSPFYHNLEMGISLRGIITQQGDGGKGGEIYGK